MNWAGQLGTGDSSESPGRAGTVLGLSDIVQVVVDSISGTSCALSRGGRVFCWGSNDDGLVGVGHEHDASCGQLHRHRCRPRPVAVASLPSIRRIASAGLSFCALAVSGDVFCWGERVGSMFGSPPSPTPVRAPGWHGVMDIWGARSYAYLRRHDGRVVELPSGSEISIPEGADVPREIAGVVCYRHRERAYCVESHRLSRTANATDGPSPGSFDVGLSSVTNVSAGAFHACAVLSSGDLWCWGRSVQNSLGEVESGLSACPDRSSELCARRPSRVRGVDSVRQVIVGYGRTCVVQFSGVVLCWGMTLPGVVSERPTRIEW